MTGTYSIFCFVEQFPAGIDVYFKKHTASPGDLFSVFLFIQLLRNISLSRYYILQEVILSEYSISLGFPSFLSNLRRSED